MTPEQEERFRLCRQRCEDNHAKAMLKFGSESRVDGVR